MQATSETRPNNSLWEYDGSLARWIDGRWKRIKGALILPGDEAKMKRAPWLGDIVWHPEQGVWYVARVSWDHSQITIVRYGMMPQEIRTTDWPGEWRLADDVIREQGDEIGRLKAESESQRSKHAARMEELIKQAREEVVSREGKIRDLTSEVERLRTASASVDTARESLDQSTVDEQAKRIAYLENTLDEARQEIESLALRGDEAAERLADQDESLLSLRDSLDKASGRHAVGGTPEHDAIGYAARVIDWFVEYGDDVFRIGELKKKIEELKAAQEAERERLMHDRRIDEHVIAQQAREIWGGGE